MIRLGLCSEFIKVPIEFDVVRALTVKHAGTNAGNVLSETIIHNLESLRLALNYCYRHEVGSFRVTSNLMPLYTHPDAGYCMEDLPGIVPILEGYKTCKEFAAKHNIRITFHPDPFVVINSPISSVMQNSLAELNYHAKMIDLLGANVVTINAGGAYGDKNKALNDFKKGFERLSDPIKELLAVENDDKNFTPEDLLPICEELGVPFAYDVHHHRCAKDSLSVEVATERAVNTWKDREPLFHISSPAGGWRGPIPQKHSDYINIDDFPDCWKKLKCPLTVDVEAEAQELAVAQLLEDLA